MLKMDHVHIPPLGGSRELMSPQQLDLYKWAAFIMHTVFLMASVLCTAVVDRLKQES